MHDDEDVVVQLLYVVHVDGQLDALNLHMLLPLPSPITVPPAATHATVVCALLTEESLQSVAKVCPHITFVYEPVYAELYYDVPFIFAIIDVPDAQVGLVPTRALVWKTELRHLPDPLQTSLSAGKYFRLLPTFAQECLFRHRDYR